MQVKILAVVALICAALTAEATEIFHRAECIFPFSYKGEEYTTCVTADGGSPWCSPDQQYAGAFFYCNKQDADSYESNGGFLRAQQKLKDNNDILKSLTNSSLSLPECARCEAAVKAAADATKDLRKIADDNERRLGWMHEKRGKDIQAFTRSIADEIEHLMDCPAGFIEYNHNCYYFGQPVNDFRSAKNQCKNRKAELVAIHSAAENQFVLQNVVSKLGTKYNTYIGFNDIRKEGKFEWTDGSESNYLNWNHGEPNAYPGENCAEMYTSSRNPKWNDILCSRRAHYYVCKKYKMSE